MANKDSGIDNQATVSFQKNMTPDSKLRGIFDMRQGWLKELHDRKKFIAVKVATEDNLADNLTKPLDGKTRKKLAGWSTRSYKAASTSLL